MIRLIPTLFLMGAVAVLALGCQTSRDVSFAYRDATYGGDNYQASDKTSVLFLVDGLSSEILKSSLLTGNIPQIAGAFTLSKKARFALGRAVFPSLTFPNITSILLGQSVAEHTITGNRVIVDGSVLDFENVTSWNELARTIQRRTIFAKLALRSQSSVSYAYAFSGGATAFQDKSVDAGVGYLENDFASIDVATIASLRRLLTETQVSKWPRFIFVHLIGVDALAHRYGPADPRVQAYLHDLDANLSEIFVLLDHPNGLSASSREVNYVMTADHGFKATPDHSPLEDVVARLNHKVRLIADNRVAPLFVDEPITNEARTVLARELLNVPHVGWAAVKSETAIDLLKKSGDHARITFAEKGCPGGQAAARFEWLGDQRANDTTTGAPAKDFACLSEFDRATSASDDSYIVPALVDYFASPQSPDMVFVADDHADFATGYAGNHGGLSRDEMLVPVLTKDVDLPRGIHPTYELLKVMGVEPEEPKDK